MFACAKPTGEQAGLADVRVLTPCTPSKMICLWSNFHQLAAKFNFPAPAEPLYFLKAPNSFHPAGAPIERPRSYAGRIIYEGELGVVIGKKCAMISETEAAAELTETPTESRPPRHIAPSTPGEWPP